MHTQCAYKAHTHTRAIKADAPDGWHARTHAGKVQAPALARTHARNARIAVPLRRTAARASQGIAARRIAVYLNSLPRNLAWRVVLHRAHTHARMWEFGEHH